MAIKQGGNAVIIVPRRGRFFYIQIRAQKKPFVLRKDGC